MASINPHDSELIDGLSNKKPSEARPTDGEFGQSLMRQYDPQPDWGRKTEVALRAKRGPTGRSRHPGFR